MQGGARPGSVRVRVGVMPPSPAYPECELHMVGRVLRVLSIDVGLCNLALWYGDMEVQPDGTVCQTTVEWRVVNVVHATGRVWEDVTKHNITECCDVMDEYLSSPHFVVPRSDAVDLVLIEQQPTNTRFGPKGKKGVPQVRMFGVSLTMRQTLKRMFPGAYMAGLVSAKLKLQLLPQDVKERAKSETDARKRKNIHKKETINIVEKMANLPADQGSKRDDLADCWLQARAWVHSRYGARLIAECRARKKAAVAASKAAAAPARPRKKKEKEQKKEVWGRGDEEEEEGGSAAASTAAAVFKPAAQAKAPARPRKKQETIYEGQEAAAAAAVSTVDACAAAPARSRKRKKEAVTARKAAAAPARPQKKKEKEQKKEAWGGGGGGGGNSCRVHSCCCLQTRRASQGTSSATEEKGDDA